MGETIPTIQDAVPGSFNIGEASTDDVRATADQSVTRSMSRTDLGLDREFTDHRGETLVSNGGFETYTTSPGAPDDWDDDTGGSATIEEETTDVRFGSNAVKITFGGGEGFFNSGIRQNVLTGGDFSHANRTIYVEGWAKTSGGDTRPTLWVGTSTFNGSFTVQIEASAPVGTTDWTRLGGSFVLPEDHDWIRLELRGGTENADITANDFMLWDAVYAAEAIDGATTRDITRPFTDQDWTRSFEDQTGTRDITRNPQNTRQFDDDDRRDVTRVLALDRLFSDAVTRDLTRPFTDQDWTRSYADAVTRDITRTAGTANDDVDLTRDFAFQQTLRDITRTDLAMDRLFTDVVARDITRPFTDQDFTRLFTDDVTRDITRSLTDADFTRAFADQAVTRAIDRVLSMERQFDDDDTKDITRVLSMARRMTDTVTRDITRTHADVSFRRQHDDDVTRSIARVLVIERALEDIVSRDITRPFTPEDFTRNYADAVTRDMSRTHSNRRLFSPDQTRDITRTFPDRSFRRQHDDDDTKDITRVLSMDRLFSDQDPERDISRTHAPRRLFTDDVARDLTRLFNDASFRRLFAPEGTALRRSADFDGFEEDKATLEDKIHNILECLDDPERIAVLQMMQRLTTETRTA